MSRPTLTENIAVLEERMLLFMKDSKKVTNKAAARRARLQSMHIRNLLKDYKKLSIKRPISNT